MILGLLAAALACEPVTPVEGTVQVAWVSRLGDRVSARGEMAVVRSAALQELAARSQGDATRVLRALGRLRGRAEARGDWKVVFFDVPATALRRPLAEADTDVLLGVPTVTGARLPGVRRRANSGCGYLLATDTGLRTLDVFLVDWATAARNGYCLMPLSRVLAGRPR